jgi:hypothetical protein
LIEVFSFNTAHGRVELDCLLEAVKLTSEIRVRMR